MNFNYLVQWFTFEIRERGNRSKLLGKVAIAWNHLEDTHPLLNSEGTYGKIRIIKLIHADKELRED